MHHGYATLPTCVLPVKDIVTSPCHRFSRLDPKTSLAGLAVCTHGDQHCVRERNYQLAIDASDRDANALSRTIKSRFSFIPRGDLPAVNYFLPQVKHFEYDNDNDDDSDNVEDISVHGSCITVPIFVGKSFAQSRPYLKSMTFD